VLTEGPMPFPIDLAIVPVVPASTDPLAPQRWDLCSLVPRTRCA